MRDSSLGVALLLLTAAAPLAVATPPAEPTVIFLVRHAEKVDPYPEAPGDPPLSDAGRLRAGHLAQILAPARITRVLSSDLRRTRETAAPLAAALGLEVELYDPGALEELLPVLAGAPGRTLVVGHSNTTPRLVELLGGAPGEPIDEPTEYDRLYTLVLAAEAEVVTIRTRYGAPATLPGPLQGVPPDRAGAPRDPGGPAMTGSPPR